MRKCCEARRKAAGRAGAPPGFPDVASTSPVWEEGPVEHGFDTGLGGKLGEELGVKLDAAYLMSLDG